MQQYPYLALIGVQPSRLHAEYQRIKSHGTGQRALGQAFAPRGKGTQ